MELAIFGAWATAIGVYDALRAFCPKRTIRCFLVSHRDGNPSVLRNLPVRELSAFASELTPEGKRNVETIIAAPDDVQSEIEALLDGCGFCNHVRADSLRWMEWTKLLYVRVGKFTPLSAFPIGCRAPFLRIYMVKSRHDRALTSPPQFPDYVIPILAGAAEGRCGISELTDDSGENISHKNGNYSELTALYWIWKHKLVCDDAPNAAREYYGLSHYRRTFAFQEDDLFRLTENEIDAVLPYPMPYEPDISAHHKRYLKEADWQAVLAALQELHPEDAAFLSETLRQPYLYPYNLIVAEKRVLRDYCAWLFPVLARTEELSFPRGENREDRYLGYVAETLETLYFMQRSERLTVAHAGCRMLT